MSTENSYRTKTEVALESLRQRIRDGSLPAGERLRVDKLKQRLGMSPTPIREALRLLQADGLVSYLPHHGIIVAETSQDREKEAYELRALLEPRAVELAVPRLTDQQIDELERLHQRYAVAIRSARGVAIPERNRAWHWALYDYSGATVLNDFIRRLWEIVPWRTVWAVLGRSELSYQQHDAIMVAVRRRDAHLAAERLRDHILSGLHEMTAARS